MRSRRIGFLTAGLAAGILSAPLALAQTELQELKQEFKTMQQNMEVMQTRINQLESEQKQVKTEQVKAKTEQDEVRQLVKEKGIEERFRWYGYFDWNFSNETRSGSHSTFDAFAFALIGKAQLSEQVDLYSQLIFEHGPFINVSVNSTTGVRDDFDPRDSGELTINDIYLTYALKEQLKLRVGKFATPFGLWNTLMYATPTYPTVKQPGRDTLYSRGSTTATDANFFGRYSTGAWFLGNYEPFFYDFYIANGRTQLDLHKDDNSNKAYGGRLGVELPVGQTRLKLVYSRYQDELRSTTTESFFRQYTNLLSGEFTWSKLKLYSEFADSQRRGTPMNAFYALAQYNLLDWLVPFVQYQFDEPNSDIAKNETHYSTLGSAFHVLPWKAVLKLQVDQVSPESSEDYQRYFVGVSAAY